MIKYFIFFLLLLFSIKANSQEIPELIFRTITNRDGLSSDIAQCIYQDSRGFMWFGTNGGICRYDGYRVKHYSIDCDRVFLNRKINNITEGPDQTLWIATDKGLLFMSLSDGSFRKPARKELSDLEVTTLLRSHNGDIWIGTANGLKRYINEKKQFISYKNEVIDRRGTRGRQIEALFEDRQHNIWIGYHLKGFSRYNPEQNHFTHYPLLGKTTTVTAFGEDDRGQLYIGTWISGVFRVENADNHEQARYIPWGTEELSRKIIYSIVQDSTYHAMWIGTSKGLYVMENSDTPWVLKDFTNVTNDNSHPSNESIRAIFSDRAGECIWLATLGGGINKIPLTPDLFGKHPLTGFRKRLGSTTVTAIYENRKNELWLGIKNKGLIAYDPQNKSIMDLPDRNILSQINTNNTTINVILKLRHRNEIWIGTQTNGIHILQTDANNRIVSIKNINKANTPKLNSKTIYSLFEDSYGNVWIGTDHGLNSAVYRNNTWIILNLSEKNNKPAIPSSLITTVIQSAKDKCVWIGTESNGIFQVKYADGNIEKAEITGYCHENNKIDCNRINVLFEDSRSNLLAGTSVNGVFKYNSEQDKFISLQDISQTGMESVHFILEDNKNDLWLGGSQGLLRYTPAPDREACVTQYDYQDGLQDNTFISAYKTPAGEICLGGYYGLNIFDPDSFAKNRYIPPVVITDICVLNRSIYRDSKTRKQYLRTSDSVQFQLCLTDKENSFSIQFAALSYANPDHNRYKYKLEGFDSDWQYTSPGQRTAQYFNLSPGSYRFKIQGSNNSGVWNGQATELPVIITPAFYATRCAWAIYILAVLFLSWFICKCIKTNNSLKAKLSGRSNYPESAEESGESENASPHTILIVGKNEKLLQTVNSSLTEEFDILTAENGLQGIEKAKSENPDIIISDSVLPLMDGYTMCEKLKNDIDTSHIPVILLTSPDDSAERTEGADTKADACLPKPVQYSLLEAQIRSLLEKRQRLNMKFKQLPVWETTNISYASLDEQFLESAIHTVEKHIDNPEFDIKLFFSEMGVTNSMLYRKLTALTGMSPNEFIRNIRLKTARKLISEKQTKITVAEVAYAVGFNSPKYFTVCFKKEFGYTPSEYLEQMKKE